MITLLLALLCEYDVYVTNTWANVREEPSVQSERVTQVLYGDRLTVIGQRSNFYQVRVTAQHDYPGWIHADLVSTPSVVYSTNAVVDTAVFQRNSTLTLADGKTVEVYAGTMFEVITAGGEKMMAAPEGFVPLGSPDVRLFSELHERSSAQARAALLATAKQFLGTSYLWGGTTPRGFDCSGFTYLAYRINGILLKRDATPQYNATRRVNRSALRSGDLVFFQTYQQGASHVGIFAGEARFIQASSSKGVVFSELNSEYYSSRYYGSGRISQLGN